MAVPSHTHAPVARGGAGAGMGTEESLGLLFMGTHLMTPASARECVTGACGRQKRGRPACAGTCASRWTRRAGSPRSLVGQDPVLEAHCAGLRKPQAEG